MLIKICDTLVDWRSDYVPTDLAPFVTSLDPDLTDPDLVVELRSVDALPDLPDPEYEISITQIAHEGAALLGWNLYEGHEDCTACLRLDGCRATILKGPSTWECSILNMLMLALLPVASALGALLMHASLVDYEGGAVAFTAPSGTGKSTHADLWVAHLSATIMNGDRAFLRRGDGGWTAYGSPWAGSSPYVLDASAPLRAVVVLEQGPENRIRRLAGPELMTRLYNNLRYPLWDELATAASLASFDELVREVPVFLLSCRPDEQAALVARDAVFGAA